VESPYHPLSRYPDPVTDHDADREYEAIIAELERVGLLEQVIDDGKPALRLTAEGKQVAQQMALRSEDDGQATAGR